MLNTDLVIQCVQEKSSFCKTLAVPRTRCCLKPSLCSGSLGNRWDAITFYYILGKYSRLLSVFVDLGMRLGNQLSFSWTAHLTFKKTTLRYLFLWSLISNVGMAEDKAQLLSILYSCCQMTWLLNQRVDCDAQFGCLQTEKVKVKRFGCYSDV